MKNYEEEERKVGSSERHYGWGEQNISSVLKVPRHCPFVLQNYEECRLPRYKYPVLTSQETHYFSATEARRLIVCKI
jgi:hypothetical protein